MRVFLLIYLIMSTNILRNNSDQLDNETSTVVGSRKDEYSTNNLVTLFGSDKFEWSNRSAAEIEGFDSSSPFRIPMVIAFVVGGVLVGVIICIFCCCMVRRRQRRRFEEELFNQSPLGDVKINIEEITPLDLHDDDLVVLAMNKGQKNSNLIRLTFDPVLGNYKYSSVIVHPFKVSATRVGVVDDELRKLRLFTGSDNVAQIYGYIVQTSPVTLHGLVIEHGEHGVLKTLLTLDELDLALKMPLLADLCRALEHVHKSSLKCHGNLSSLCCVVDSHFVLKLQLTEFPTLNNLAPNTDKLGEQSARGREIDKVWTSPEVLRKEPKVNLALADIYSFGIITHEIVYQKGPFYVSSKEIALLHNPKMDGILPKTPIDCAHFILNILRNKTRRQIRPTFIVRPDEVAAMLILKDMMKACWEDSPVERCNLNKINQCIRRAMRQMGIVCAFGSMIERLEFYTKHLQEAVEVKGDKVDEERDRLRRVLEQLFPGVANALIHGESPKPVQYNCICVYFNDLVGFTVICGANTPDIVVKFLDTLFLKYDEIIEMYNIHPVTRIGDAYMLVSGIPVELNSKYHATEIAQAALQLVEVVRNLSFPEVKEHKTMQIRTGIASGRAASGVLGQDCPSYGIVGDAVTLASKMESNSEAMKILVAESSYLLLKDEFEFESKAKEVKVGSSSVNAHFLKSMKTSKEFVMDKRLDG